jgi:hypothetical protein
MIDWWTRTSRPAAMRSIIGPFWAACARGFGDRRVLALVAFLRAGILGEDGIERDTAMGTPQGVILSAGRAC